MYSLPRITIPWVVTTLWAGFLFALTGCSQTVVNTPTELSTPAIVSEPTLGNTSAPTPTGTPPTQATSIGKIDATAASPVTATATATPVMELCSPLEEIRLAELGKPDLMKNPFQMPRPGIDDGHPGVDFAYWSRGERKTMLGLPVRSILPGKVAGLVNNRPPYGYAVILETRLSDLPQAWLAQLRLPPPAPTVAPAPNLICPAPLEGVTLPTERSLYLLYAHLNLPPDLAVGQSVACGQVIGEVGTTGRSVNPHLHLETRLGPAGATFTELAHYDNAATENEMRNYCTWRVSGLYQAFDPLVVLQAFSLQP